MVEWIIDLIGRSGYLGIALMMLLENLFPPIPSWLVMPFAGFQASAGRLSPWAAILAGTAGSTLGAAIWYRVANLVGVERVKTFARRHGHWLTISPAQLEAADRWFDRFGPVAVLFGRLVPTVRTLISVPAGVFALDFRRFLLFTAIGDAMWNGLLTGAGYLLERRYAEVAHYLKPVGLTVLGIVATIYVVRVIRWRKP